MTTPASKPFNITVNDDGHIVIKFTDSTIEGEKLKEDFITDVKCEGGKITQDDAARLIVVLLQVLKNQEAEMKSGKSDVTDVKCEGGKITQDEAARLLVFFITGT